MPEVTIPAALEESRVVAILRRTEARLAVETAEALLTGGVTLDNAATFIAAGAWGLGLGSALVAPDLVAAGRFDELTRRAAAFAEIAAVAGGHIRSAA